MYGVELSSAVLVVTGGLLGSCHRIFELYAVIAASAVFNWVDLARALASAFKYYRTWFSNFLTLYSAVEKVCLWAVFLFMKHEKKRKLKQPLCDYNFGLP